MTKKELDILGKAMEAEVYHAIEGGGIEYGLYQTKSKVAKKLEEEGYLEFVKVKDGWMEYEGYVLTHKGRMEYCMSDRCQNAEEEE